MAAFQQVTVTVQPGAGKLLNAENANDIHGSIKY